MKLLLDTHALLWFISNDPQLSVIAKREIEDESNETFVSIASLWEISIKLSLGKLRLPVSFDEAFPHQIDINGFELLPISYSELGKLTRLPIHHRDPFDRLLIAQAVTQQLKIITCDPAFSHYSVDVVW